MASTSASGLEPKRRIATYGKAHKRRAPTLGLVSVQNRNSPATASTAKSIEQSLYNYSDSESEKPPRRAAESRNTTTITTSTATTSTTTNNINNKRESVVAPPSARTANGARSLTESQSQPLPVTAQPDGEWEEGDRGLKAKKRKLTRTYSEKREKSAAAYSTPDSSPSAADMRSPGSASLEHKTRTPPAKNLVSGLGVAAPRGGDVTMKDAAAPRQKAQVAAPSPKISRPLAKPVIASQDGTQRPQPRQPQQLQQQQLQQQQQQQQQQRQHNIPMHLSRDRPPRPNGILKPRQLPANKPKPVKPPTSTSTTPQPRRVRLIDALAAQAESESSSEDESFEEAKGRAARESPPPTRITETPPPAVTPQQKPKVVMRQPPSAKRPGPKFTYGQERTMLAEQDPLLDVAGLSSSMAGEPSKTSLFDLSSFGKPSTVNKFAFLDEDDETGNTGAVRSIHELRQAGANSRFADEMADIMDRIGSPSAQPSSLRRGGLLELADKMREKDFRRQFRNYSSDGSLFQRLDEETDVIAGYAIVSILVPLLASSSASHLVHQLASQGIAALLARLLVETADVTVIVKDKKRNVSKNGQATLSTIKSVILHLAVWEPAAPKSLSPRTLALKCLDLLMRQSAHAADEDAMLPVPITDLLFSVLSEAAKNQGYLDFPSQPESNDAYLALAVLEGHSVNAMQSERSTTWASQYAPVVANVLETALRRPADQLDEFESLTLRLTLNLTNHNPLTPGIFIGKGLLRELAKGAYGAFTFVQTSIKSQAYPEKALQALIFMLGVMINFCEHYPPAAQSLDEVENQSGPSPVSQLIRMFLENYSQTSDADSMEKTHLNVAFGYLSILLGYLCLRDSIRERFESIHSNRTLEPLIGSIRHFISFHQLVSSTIEGQSGAENGSSAAVHLESLVEKLENGR